MQPNFTANLAKTPIFVNRIVVGYVTGDVFAKTISFSKHALRQPPALAFDLSTLDDAEQAGARLVEVTDRESGRVYRADLITIRAKGFAVNRNFGQQWALTLAYWSIDGQRPRNTPVIRSQQARLF